MKITLSPYLDTRRAVGDKPMNMMIVMTRSGKSAMLPVGIKLPPSVWDKKTKTVLKCPQKAFFDKAISDKYYEIQETLKKIAETDKEQLNTLSISKIKDMVMDIIDGINRQDDGIPTLEEYFNSVIAKKSGSTKWVYLSTLRKIKRFPNYSATMKLDELTKAWLEKFENFLKQEDMSVNTRWAYLSRLHSVVNSAIDDGLLNIDVFRNFKIKKEPTLKRNLSASDIRTFATLPLSGKQEMFRDIAMLSFYLIGINITDLFKLTTENVNNGRIEYIRSKTHRMYSIKIQPEAQKILDKYKGEKHLLKIADDYASIESFKCMLNTNMKKIGTVSIGKNGKEKMKPLNQRLTSYYMRHSWATIAYNDCNIPVDIISQALGHSMGSKITMVYINTDYKKVDEANRKVIDFVMGKQ